MIFNIYNRGPHRLSIRGINPWQGVSSPPPPPTPFLKPRWGYSGAFAGRWPVCGATYSYNHARHFSWSWLMECFVLSGVAGYSAIAPPRKRGALKNFQAAEGLHGKRNCIFRWEIMLISICGWFFCVCSRAFGRIVYKTCSNSIGFTSWILPWA